MRLIDADKMAVDESEAYMSAQAQITDDLKWLVNFAAHSKMQRLIADAPAVDAVEVVRCRECKQGEIDDPDFPDEYYCHEGCGWNKGDFYCAYGERKDGDGNG